MLCSLTDLTVSGSLTDLAVSGARTFHRSASCPSYNSTMASTNSYRLNKDLSNHNASFPTIAHSKTAIMTLSSQLFKIKVNSSNAKKRRSLCLSQNSTSSVDLDSDPFKTPPQPPACADLIECSPPLLRRRRLNLETFTSACSFDHLSIPILPSEKIRIDESACYRLSIRPNKFQLQPRFEPTLPKIDCVPTSESTSSSNDEDRTAYTGPSRKTKLSPTSTYGRAFDRDQMSFMTRMVENSCCATLTNDLNWSELYSAFENVNIPQKKVKKAT